MSLTLPNNVYRKQMPGIDNIGWGNVDGEPAMGAVLATGVYNLGRLACYGNMESSMNDTSIKSYTKTAVASETYTGVERINYDTEPPTVGPAVEGRIYLYTDEELLEIALRNEGEGVYEPSA